MNHLPADLYECLNLQRKGATMKEIAELLDLDLSHVVKILYWDRVR